MIKICSVVKLHKRSWLLLIWFVSWQQTDGGRTSETDLLPRSRRRAGRLRSPPRRLRCPPRTRRCCRGLWRSSPARCAARCRAACWASRSEASRSTRAVHPSASRPPEPGSRTPCRRSWWCRCRTLAGRVVLPSPSVRLQQKQTNTPQSISRKEIILSCSPSSAYRELDLAV